MLPDAPHGPVAFVLGGGGVRGAVEVGQARALFEVGIVPDMVVGTSIGAINGALIARTPSIEVIEPLVAAWSSEAASKIYNQSVLSQLGTLARQRNHALSAAPLYDLLNDNLGATTEFSDLAVPFSTVAASIERAGERWFDSGLVVPAVAASASVPGLLPPAEIDGEHHYDGGMVASIPLGRAIQQGARTIYVLQVGRIEEPLTRPTNVLDAMFVSFEIARRHRFAHDLATLPQGVTVHVLPSGGTPPGSKRLAAAFPTLASSADRMRQAYRRSREFLTGAAPQSHPNPGDLSVPSPYGMTVRGRAEAGLRRAAEPEDGDR